MSTTGFDVAGVTVAEFCLPLSGRLDRNVIDRTGITGTFDVHLELAPGVSRPLPPPPPPVVSADPGAAPPAPPDPGDVFLAMQTGLQKLGLKLESAKSPVEFLVIDRVERPSEN